MFIYNNHMDNEDSGQSGNTNNETTQSPEVTVQAAVQPDVYDELEDIETLTNAGVLPHDVDRYLLEGSKPGGIQGPDALQLTLEVSQVKLEHPELSAQDALAIARTKVERSKNDIWGDSVDLEPIRSELSQISAAREQGDATQYRSLMCAYINKTCAEDIDWKEIGPRAEQLIYSGLAPEVLELISTIGSPDDSKGISVDAGVQFIAYLGTPVRSYNLDVLYPPMAHAVEKIALTTHDEQAVEDATTLLLSSNKTVNINNPTAFNKEAQRVLEQYSRLLPGGGSETFNNLEVLNTKRELGFIEAFELAIELEHITRELIEDAGQVVDRAKAGSLATDLVRIAKVAASGGAPKVFESTMRHVTGLMAEFDGTGDAEWYLGIDAQSFQRYLSQGGDLTFALQATQELAPELHRYSALDALKLAYEMRGRALQTNSPDTVSASNAFFDTVLKEAVSDVESLIGSGHKELISVLLEHGEFGILSQHDLGYTNMDVSEIGELITMSISVGSLESLDLAIKLVGQCRPYARTEVFQDLLQAVDRDTLAGITKVALNRELASVKQFADRDKAALELTNLVSLLNVSSEFLSHEETLRISTKLVDIAQTADFEYCYTHMFDQLSKLNHLSNLRTLEYSATELKAMILQQGNPLELMERLDHYPEESLQNITYLGSTTRSADLGTELTLYLLKNGIAPEESSDMIRLFRESHASMTYKTPEETLEEIFTQHLDKANADVLGVICRNQGVKDMMAFLSDPDKVAHLSVIRGNMIASEKLAQLIPLHLIPNYESDYVLDISEGKVRGLTSLIESKPEIGKLLADYKSPIYTMTSHIITGIMGSKSPSEAADIVMGRVGEVEKLTSYINGLANNPEFIATFTSEILLNPDPRRIDDLVEFVESNKDFFALFSDHNSLLYQLRDSIVGEVLLSANPQAEITAIMDILSGDVPIWVRLYKLAELRYGEAITDTESILYPVTTIPLIRTELGERPTLVGIEGKELKLIDVSALVLEDKLHFVIPEIAASIDQYSQIKSQLGREPQRDELPVEIRLHVATLRDSTGIPFSWLQEGYRQNVFGYYLRRSVERSVDANQKASADTRNRSISSPELTIPAGSFIHGTQGKVLPQVLALGNFCGEVLEFGHKVDATPLQVDLSILGDEEDLGGDKALEAIQGSVAYGYGTDLFLIFDRSNDSFEEGVVHRDGPWKDRGQVLLPVGVPSTDVRAIVMHQHHGVSLEDIERNIVHNGFYIPIYDHSGSLVFTPEQYDQQKAVELHGVNKERVIESVEADDFEPLTLIDELSLDPELGQLYAKDSGVWEGYSIREHTEAILGQFEKYFADNMEGTTVSVPTFRIVLALHDIGKPLSVERTGGTAAQHRFTHEIVRRRGGELGLEKDEIEVALEVVSHDVIGEFLKGEKTVEETSGSILGSASRLGVQPLGLLELLKVYYLCDASSYTSDASFTAPDGSTAECKPSLDFLFTFSNGSIGFSANNQARIDDLTSQLSQ